MSKNRRTAVTEHQEKVLDAIRRLRDRGLEPATPIEIGREAGFKDTKRRDTRTVDGFSTVSASSKVQSALTALVHHGLVERGNRRRGGGTGSAYTLVLSPEEEFIEWVLSIERDQHLARTVTLRQIVERAKAASRNGK